MGYKYTLWKYKDSYFALLKCVNKKKKKNHWTRSFFSIYLLPLIVSQQSANFYWIKLFNKDVFCIGLPPGRDQCLNPAFRIPIFKASRSFSCGKLAHYNLLVSFTNHLALCHKFSKCQICAFVENCDLWNTHTHTHFLELSDDAIVDSFLS